MSIAAYQISTAVFAASTVGLTVIVAGLRSRIQTARGHVANLLDYVSAQAKREADLIRQNDELNEIVTKVHDQRQRALRKAQDKNRAANEAKAAVKAQATVKTLSELKMHPLRRREEVLADMRSSKAAQQVSSAG